MSRLRMLASVLIAVLLLAGCSSSKPGAGTDTSASGPQSGGILYKPILYGDPSTLDPLISRRTASVQVQTSLFSTLIVNDWTDGGKIVPDAADNYKVSPDGKTLTFNLRKGVKFHHDGREAKAADWVYSLSRPLDKKWNSGSYAKLLKVEGAEEFYKGTATEVKGLKALDEYTFQITLKEPDSAFLQGLTETWAAVVPKDYVEKVGMDFGVKPVGTGPFKFKKWNKDDYIALERFDQYHKGPAPLQGVVFRVMNEANTRQAEFVSGNLDFTVMTDVQYKQFSNDDKWKANIIPVPELFTRTMQMNVTKAPFNNVKVRQAMNYAIDRKSLIDKVLYNKAFMTTGPLPSSSPGFNKDLKGYDYDPAKAKTLLAEAGFPNGFEFEMTVDVHPVVGATFADALSQYLSPLGIKVKTKQLEGAAFLQAGQSGDFQALGYSTGGDVDPVNFLWTRFHSKNAGVAGNWTRFSNAQVDSLLDQAKVTTDQTKRMDQVHQAEKIILEETPWFIYNYNKAVILHQPWVHGLVPVPTDIDFQDLHKVWIDKNKQRSNWP